MRGRPTGREHYMISRFYAKFERLSPVKTIAYSFTVLIMFLIIANVYHTNHVQELKVFSNTIYKHPLVVSNASLKAKADLLQIQRDVFQLVLRYFHLDQTDVKDNKHLKVLYEDVEARVNSINKELDLIHKNILGEEGRALADKAKTQFEIWKKIHKQFFESIEHRETAKVHEHMQNFPQKQVYALNRSFEELHAYARTKADGFSMQIESDFEYAHKTDLISGIFIILIFFIIGLYTTIKVNNYLRREESLKTKINEQKLQYEYAINGTQDGLWDWNLVDKTIFFSSNWKKMLGYENDELENEIGTWEALVHPDDIDWAEADILEATKNPDINYENVHRLRHKDGHWVWILDRAQVVFNVEGLAIRMIGFHTDITLQKEQELALGALSKLVNNVIDTIEGLIFVKDINYKYILCNEAFCKFIGKSKDKIIGFDDFALFEKEDAEFFRSHDADMFKIDRASSNYEWVNYSDASRRYLITTKSPLRNSKEETVGLVGFSTDITEHKNLEEELVRQQALLKQAQKISKLGYWTLNAGEEDLVWSEEVYELFSYDENKSSPDLQMFKDRLHPDDADRVLDSYFESVSSKTLYECKHRLLFPNKEIRYVLEMAKHEYDENGVFLRSVGTVQDITKDTLIEMEIKKREARQLELGYIIEHTQSELYLFDEQSLKFILVNQAVLLNLGFTVEEMMQMTPLDLKKELQDTEFNSVLQPLIDGSEQQVSLETVHVRKDGTSYPVRINIQKTTYDNKSVYLAVATDITKESKAQKEIKEQEEIMIAQSRHAAMGEMIGMIAHQWRQPITTIAMGANNMLADIALEASETKNVEEMANMIVEQTQYLSQTIEDFRNFFKPEKEKSSVRLASVIENTLSIITDSMKANAILIKMDIDPEASVKTYERELIQVYINVLKNAKEALVESRVKDPYVHISVFIDDDKVITKICDNAGGVKKDIRDKIFDPYFTTKDEKTGTGLGLYMSKTIVDKHLLGELSVECSDKGSCFIISLDKENNNE